MRLQTTLCDGVRDRDANAAAYVSQEVEDAAGIAGGVLGRKKAVHRAAGSRHRSHITLKIQAERIHVHRD
jgi:hypothetical protein